MTTPASTSDLLTQAEHRKLTKFFSRTFIIGGITSGIASLFDSSSGLFTWWDNYLTAITSTLYVISGLIIYLRPKWLSAAVILSLIPSAIYQHGVMFLAIHHPSEASLYSATSSGPFFPLIFVVPFIGLQRGASTLSWIHCAGFYVQFFVNTVWFADPFPSSARSEAEHLLIEAMMAYPLYILSISYITKLRERLHTAQEEAFKQKEKFLGLLSHEIRNQMQTMVGSLELLDLRLKDPAERQSVDRLQTAASDLQTYLNNINELTKLDDPALTIEKSPFNLSQLLEDIRDEWLPQAQEQSLRLTVQIDGPLILDSDESRLRQVISNLVSNALKYTDTGSVTITAYASTESLSRAVIEVVDTGIGIDEKSQQEIFLPHVRLKSATCRRVTGSGLGLTIVERLINRLGGSIRVVSHLGQGTRFSVTVPGLASSQTRIQTT